MSKEFVTLIDSLGHMALEQSKVPEIRIEADETLGTASVIACTPRPLTDSEYVAVLDRLVSVREFYFDELSIDFAIETCEDAELMEEDHSHSRQFAYTGS